MRHCRFPALLLLALLLQKVEWVGGDALASDLYSAPLPPRDVTKLPRTGPRKQDLGAGFTVNGNSREEVRQFYLAVYLASENIPVNSSANTQTCAAGTNSTALLNAELWRINWFRAISGIPAAITFSAPENAGDQAAALLMSANNELLHADIPGSWSCFDVSGTNAAFNSNLALGFDGPAAITSYIWDYGAANAQAGHRRWLLYPQTQIMGSGDVPAQASFAPANATWVLDGNYGGPRPATSHAFVAWPPPGYAPWQVVFPQWSFALSNADLSSAEITMESNGVPISIVIQPYAANAGEDTLVWYPSALDPTSVNTIFPFGGMDTTYAVTVGNVLTVAGPQSFSYTVTLFDPAQPGADTISTRTSGTNQPSVNENNPYTCAPSPNPNLTGYQWLAAQPANGNLTDLATNGLANFTISPSPPYSVTTNPPVGSGKCFHLTHTNPAPQLLQFTELLFPATNTSLSFQSLLGYSTTNEVARVQASTNGGGSWDNLFTQAGANGPGQTAFVTHTLSLSNYAGQFTTVRFNYDFLGGNYYGETLTDVGWCLEHIVLTNNTQLVNALTNAVASTNYDFVPARSGNWLLAARGVIFNQFGLSWSAAEALVAVTNHEATLLSLGPPALVGGQAQIPFVITQGAATVFNLLQAGQLTGPWSTNASAVLVTNTPGASFQFNAPFPGTTIFYRVEAH